MRRVEDSEEERATIKVTVFLGNLENRTLV